MEIIVSHSNLDFDSLAAMVAAKKLYPEAKMVLVGAQNSNVREFISLHQEVFQFEDAKNLDKSAITRVIVVDTRVAERLGDLVDAVKQPGVEVFVFDHHPAGPEDMRADQDFCEEVGATTTILVKLIREKQIRISPLEATLFALGIHEDTGSLTYPTATDDDADALAYLMAQKAGTEIIHRFLNPALTPVQHRLFEKLLDSAHVVSVKGIPIMFAGAVTDEYIDNASVLTHKMSDVENVDVVFTFVRMRERVHIIGRSKLKEVDVAQVLSHFEGGGHPQAASAVTRITDFSELENRVREVLGHAVKEPVRAGEIMSRHIHTVESSVPVSQASKMLQAYGYFGLPVLERGKLVGIITKKDVAKALMHGLVHAPVKGFMSRHLLTVGPNEPVYQIERIMSEEDVGYLPVVEDDTVIGIIDRESVLKELHGADYYQEAGLARAEKPKFTRAEIIARIQKLLPGEIQALLRRVGDLAEEQGLSVFLVGGFVRDILMNQSNLDIDLVIEGDGIAFARVLVQEFGGRLRAHRKFGTAVAVLPSDFRIDMASARREFYEYPAALPQVELSTVREDLGRRDFTVNAMALALNTSRFGELLDYYGGQRDLDKKQIRVLHSLSFVEDPTRIFRAVRFEQRYGFRMEAETERLAKKAIEMELVGQLTNARIRDELVLILSEKEPWRALRRLYELTALRTLHPGIHLDGELRALLVRVGKAFPELEYYFHAKTKRWLVYLMALLSGVPREEVERWATQMRFRKQDTRILLQGVFEVPRVLKSLTSGARLKNSQVYDLLKGLSPEAITYTFARSSQKSVRQRIIFYLANLKGVRLSVSGRDLNRMGFAPSPLYQLALESLLKAKLDGVVRSRDEELNFISEKLRKLEKGVTV